MGVWRGPSGGSGRVGWGGSRGVREEAVEGVHATRPLVIQLARLGGGAVRIAAIGEARADGSRIGIDELYTLRIGRDVEAAALVPTGTTPSFVS